MAGIEDAMTPPAPITGNAYDLNLPGLAADWQTAIDRFEASELIARILPSGLIRNLVMTKRQDLSALAAIPHEAWWKTYLETV